MEGVADKLCWDVYLRVGKPIPIPIPIPHPVWKTRLDMARALRQLTLPIEEQLEEDAKWKE